MKNLNFDLKLGIFFWLNFLFSNNNVIHKRSERVSVRLLCEQSVHFHSLYLVLFDFVSSQVFGNNLYYVKHFVEYTQNFANERTFENQSTIVHIIGEAVLILSSTGLKLGVPSWGSYDGQRGLLIYVGAKSSQFSQISHRNLKISISHTVVYSVLVVASHCKCYSI